MHCNRTLRTPFVSLAALVALVGGVAISLGAGDASANIIINSAGTTELSVKITNMPDLDQRRAWDDMNTPWDFSDDIFGLPNNGSMYCAPTSVMNLFIYAANHGFPGLAPGPGSWATGSSYNLATAKLIVLGNAMDTDPVKGTKGGVSDGMVDWIVDSGAAGDFLVLAKRRGFFEYPRAKDLAGFAQLGGISMFCYGRYPVAGTYFGYPSASRDGGHCVTFNGYTRSGSSQSITYRDPATDKENLYAQSTWATQTYPITDMTVYIGTPPLGSFVNVSAMAHPFGDGKIRIIDGIYVLLPRFGLSFKNLPGPAKITTRKTTPLTWPVQDAGGAAPSPEVTLSLDGAMAGWAPQPYGAGAWTLIEPAAGGPALLHHTDLVTGETAALPDAPTGLLHLTAGRREDLFAASATTLFRLGEDGVMLDSLPLADVSAIAYDDGADEVLAISVVNGVIWRVARTLDAITAVMPIPVSVPLSGKADLVADPLEAGRVWFISEASSTIFGLNWGGPAISLETITLPAVQSPSALEVDERGRLYAVCNGLVVGLSRFPGIGWMVDESLVMHGESVGDGFVIGRGRVNYDPEELESDEWRNLDHEELMDGVEAIDCAADLDFDGVVSGADLGILLSQWGQPGTADLNGDATVDGLDLGILLTAWGTCGD